MQNKQYQLRSQESEDERSRSRARNLSAASLARFAASWPGFRGRRMRQEWLNGSAPRRIAGYTACGLLLASVATRQGPWTLGHFAAVLGVFLFIFAMRRASWVATSDTRSADEGGIGRFSELSDRLEKRIEELQDVQWELQEKEARYRDLLDTQQDIILRRNGAGQLTFVNTAFCRTFGVKADEVLGRPFTPTVSETEGQKPRLEEISRRHRQFVERVMTKSGLCWIAWDEQLISTGSNGDFEVQGVGRDVTRERAQQEQLQEARDQSEAANRAKSRFLAAMSHEIRTPMNGILGMSSLIRDTKLSDEQRTYSRAIDQSARTLLTLIDEILDFSKIEAGKLVLQSLPFVLEKAVQSAVELMAVRAHEKDLEISWTVSPRLPRLVVGDEVRLRQILLNLISNAVKFTDSGGVTVTVDRCGDVCASSGSMALEILVMDTGIGLSQEDKQRLFAEFEQADSAVRRRNGGTGLGLAISRRLAMAMGGDISVESSPGQGATFRLKLNVRQVVETLDEITNIESTNEREPHRVLLAYDRPMERQTTAHVLESHNIEVVESDLREALRLLNAADNDLNGARDETGVFTCVLVDASGSPEMAGAVLQAARKRHPTANVQGVVLANVLARSELTPYKAEGFSGFLVRPVRPVDLIRQISTQRIVAVRNRSDETTPPEDQGPIGELAPVNEIANSLNASNGDRDARRTKVLLVEDNDINALLATRMIEKAGCSVHALRSGLDAVAAMQRVLDGDEAAYDLVLMDIHMPGIDGVEAARQIKSLFLCTPSGSKLDRAGLRASPVCPPIVALTANAFSEDKQRYLDAGMDGYLAKPFDASDLEGLIARWSKGTSKAS